MELYDCDKGKVLGQVVLANTFRLRLFGLIGKTPSTFQRALWLMPCRAIHMLGMAAAIDAIFLDRGQRVVEVRSGLKPFSLGHMSWKAHSVVECFQGILDVTSISIGDRLELRNTS